jgi:hypothetical protein
MRIDTGLAGWGLGPIHVESVRDVCARQGSLHFALWGGFSDDSWYVQTPSGL